MSKFARTHKFLNPREPEPRFSGPAALLSLNSSGTVPPATSSVFNFLLSNALPVTNSLLNTAAEALDDDSVKILAKEIENGWRLENMSAFIEGFLKGAGVEVSKVDG
ncbi:hypothetical protein RUND412_000237 [Rhizina undulata]